MFYCPYCAHFTVRSFKKLLTHIRFTHSHEPNFSITCGECEKRFTKFTSFKSHIRRKHGDNHLLTVEVPQNDELENDDELVDSDNEYNDHLHVQDNSVDNITRFLALFILKTKEMNQLSQQALNAIVSNTQDIVEQSLDAFKDRVVRCLYENGIRPEEVQGLDAVLHDQNDFAKACETLKTEYLQIKYFVENFHLVVSILCKLYGQCTMLPPPSMHPLRGFLPVTLWG